SPRDRFVVDEPASHPQVWWGNVNRPVEEAAFDRLLDRVRSYLQGRELFVCDAYACADARHRLRVRVVTEYAWQALFARCLLLRVPPAEQAAFTPDMTILVAPGMHADPVADRTRSEV